MTVQEIFQSIGSGALLTLSIAILKFVIKTRDDFIKLQTDVDWIKKSLKELEEDE